MGPRMECIETYERSHFKSEIGGGKILYLFVLLESFLLDSNQFTSLDLKEILGFLTVPNSHSFHLSIHSFG